MFEHRDIDQAITTYSGLSMVPYASKYDLGLCVKQVIAEDIPGVMVEMGCWKGGCGFIMADLVRQSNAGRSIFLFDSFKGLGFPEAIDGKAAQEYWNSTEDHCVANQEELENYIKRFEFNNYIKVFPGWFEDTVFDFVKLLQRTNQSISILRIDCDWYKSVGFCLYNLYPFVFPGGFIIIDDYSAYDGAAIATHEFLGMNKLSHRLTIIEQAGIRQAARFRKL